MRALRWLPWGSLLVSVIMPASGSVLYTLTGVTAGFFHVPVSFAYTAPTFITQQTPIPPDAFLLCANANCHDAVFTPHLNFGQGPGSILDAIGVQISINGGGFEGGLCGCPLRWHKKLRHYSQLAENFYADSGPVLQNECRLAKQRRALQECNWPRNNQPETHRDDEPGSGGFAAP